MTLPTSRQSTGSSRADRSRQASPSRFPMIRTLLRGYLHEDFLTEHASAEGAVRAFCTDASPAEIRKLIAEWRMLSANTANWTVGEIASFLTKDLGGAWMPESKRELAQLFQVLKSAGA
jgi:hypothetical protein